MPELIDMVRASVWNHPQRVEQEAKPKAADKRKQEAKPKADPKAQAQE